MRSIPGYFAIIAVTTLATIDTPRLDAQHWAGGEYERRTRPGYNVPFDGAPYTQIYNYETGSLLYFGGNPRGLIYQEYLDRVDRAMKFGYRMPDDPFGPKSPYNRGYQYDRPRMGVGIGTGFFRWR